VVAAELSVNNTNDVIVPPQGVFEAGKQIGLRC
jgi:hypothetical protein